MENTEKYQKSFEEGIMGKNTKCGNYHRKILKGNTYKYGEWLQKKNPSFSMKLGGPQNQYLWTLILQTYTKNTVFKVVR